MINLKGIPASGGIAIGPAYLWTKEELIVPKQVISDDQIATQIQIFEEALIKTRREILDLQKKIADEMGQDEAEIFDAHLLVLEDRTIIEEVISQLKKDKLSAAYVFQDVLRKYVQVFLRIEDEYLKERVSDINDVGRRVLRNLLGKTAKPLEELQEKVILVSHDLSPSDTAMMHRKNVLAFVTNVGGKTSHTAIMAKSMEIPAVVGLEVATLKIKTGDTLIIDGSTGLVFIDPDSQTLESYQRQKTAFKDTTQRFIGLKDKPALTLDGTRVHIAANIELPDEIPSLKEHGADGIGLYRTEFFYMNRVDLPTEEEHYEAYKFVAEAMNPHSVTIRTLDLGGDKFISHLEIPREMSPFLGWRAIRFCLARPDMFKSQLRAILRASAHGKLKLMYPMISGIEELRQANVLLEECKNELRQRKSPFDESIEVGAMIEVPSAAMTADILAREVDFFSIGTNDLIQYSIAVDRSNEKVAYLYEPAHPGVLRFIKHIIDIGHAAGIRVGMCGEMAGDSLFSLVLLGLGLDEFSMPSVMIPEIKHVIRSVTMAQASQIATQALSLPTAKEVESFIQSKLDELEIVR
ncbi:MAG: phosphoenolpyruvate--protein phosphotransferase [Omnitrophica WOR_2 bacterium GWF2_43_52]|nr:MAG: phosphoenolpyruvate--protein phosphotransferase [Omnitrophica WOR_2 bacterium GWC2_44_8]OGX20780.1 MAG: phosphoenolpyruvate--protein phosphotransferase [Omnitrophica WOR_2 bacterium GWF2_43_52]OGX56897.1 MAG: phosphoenolpyruvate--protein phosphotransferase [Omnitrophica WOR_2 bacterium RIFOXYC2_FULL_43_9]HAH19807.1 phosphoenolpyruvate--protein phosphotransferase [Candidatus Omnitrophota bacterium]HBG63432.1 phosphoenolpyruvate--protein phosphotransferase [Candidatus Omnitrophota bacteri